MTKQKESAMRDCGTIFNYYDTDKNKFHSYGPAYDSFLTPEVRKSALNVMEVGIADGAGLLSWREIFPGAMDWIRSHATASADLALNSTSAIRATAKPACVRSQVESSISSARTPLTVSTSTC